MGKMIVSWCRDGLEGIADITELEKQRTWDLLSGKPIVKDEINSIVFMMVMRAKANLQRHYEVYALETVDSITADDIRALFQDAPQQAADLIRERGTSIYSDREMKKKHVIF